MCESNYEVALDHGMPVALSDKQIDGAVESERLRNATELPLPEYYADRWVGVDGNYVVYDHAADMIGGYEIESNYHSFDSFSTAWRFAKMQVLLRRLCLDLDTDHGVRTHFPYTVMPDRIAIQQDNKVWYVHEGSDNVAILPISAME